MQRQTRSLVNPNAGGIASLNISAKEWRPYSVARAIRALVEEKPLSGYERDCSDELKHQGFEARSNHGVVIPTAALVGRRDMSVGTASAGGYLVGTENISFIDALRSRLIVSQMGATVLPGLRGNVTIPKQTGGATAYWLSDEGAEITESDQVFGQISMSPKNVGAYTEASRQLIMQASPAADWVISNDLARVVSAAIDAAAISGSGTGGAPTGLLNTAGIGSVTGTSLAYAGILEFQTDVLNSNVVANPQTTGFVATPTVAALLAGRQRFSSTDSPLWQGNIFDGRVTGFRAMSTTACPSGSMIFGDFSQLLIGEWGILEIATNPHTDFKRGIIGIRAIQSVDIGFRYPSAFSVAASIT